MTTYHHAEACTHDDCHADERKQRPADRGPRHVLFPDGTGDQQRKQRHGRNQQSCVPSSCRSKAGREKQLVEAHTKRAKQRHLQEQEPGRDLAVNSL